MARNDDGPGLFGYLLRGVFVLILVAGVGFVAFAYLGDLGNPAAPRVLPVTLGTG